MAVRTIVTSNGITPASGPERERFEGLTRVAAHQLAADVSVSLKQHIDSHGYMPDSAQIGSRTENFVCDVRVVYSPSTLTALDALRAAVSGEPINFLAGSLCDGIEAALPGYTVLGLSPGRSGATAIVRDDEYAKSMAEATGEPITTLKPQSESVFTRLVAPLFWK
jgi:hypothetical protein